MVNQNNSLRLAISILICTTLFSACVKNIKDNSQLVADISSLSQIQFINAGISTTRNSVYIDGTPVNNATIAFGGQFPTGSNLYFATQQGIRSLLVRDTLATSVQPPLNFSQIFQGSSRYTVFLYDTVTTVKQKTVQTDIIVPSVDSIAMVRFANFVYSKVAIPAVDIYSIKKGINVFTNVQTTEVSNFIPYPASVNDTLLVRETGTTNQLTQLYGFNPARKRSYTVVFRGSYRTTSGATARTLSSYLNY
jgi:hypothetical protein